MKFLVLGVLATCLILANADTESGPSNQNATPLEKLIKVLKDKVENLLDEIENKVSGANPESGVAPVLPSIADLPEELREKAEKILEEAQKKIDEIDPLKRVDAIVANITDNRSDEIREWCVNRERCKIEMVCEDLRWSVKVCIKTASEKAKIVIDDFIEFLIKLADGMIDIENRLKACDRHVISVIRWKCLTEEIERSCGLIKKGKIELRIRITNLRVALAKILKELQRCSACAERIAIADSGDIDSSIDKCYKLHHHKTCH